MLGDATMTLVITNESVQSDSTGVSVHQYRADTFAGRRYIFPEPGPQPPRVFADEKESFFSMLPMLEARYPGEYVAVAKGTIVDHDRSRVELVRRFFSRFTDTPVYIGLVGARDVAWVPTPFIRRSR